MIETNTPRHTFRPMYVVLVLLGLGVLMSIFPLFRPSDVEKAPPVPDPSDVVDVIVDEKSLRVPDEFRRNLQDVGIASIVLVDNKGRLRAYTIDGASINLCGPRPKGSVGDQMCKHETTSQELVLGLTGDLIVAIGDCGFCDRGDGKSVRCHRSGQYEDQWKCINPLGHNHYGCADSCK
jgi:hypothetical protein